jgi:ABC-type branched-subunit amino acid transport system ATPase component
MSDTTLLSARDLQVRFGGVLAVNKVSFGSSAARCSR